MTRCAHYRWKDDECNVLLDEIIAGTLHANMRIDQVSDEVLRKLPGRTADGVRQYVTRHIDKLVGGVLGDGDIIGALANTIEPQCKRGRVVLHPKKKKKNKVVRMAAPQAPLLAAVNEPPPPEMVPLLPRAITFGAKRMRLEAHGFMASYLCELPASSFEKINTKLGMQRDARTESWDGLPRFV